MKQICVLLICLVFSFGSFSADKESKKSFVTAPIGNVEVEQATITSDELYGIFTLLFRYWDDGTKVHIVLMSDTFGTHHEFLWEFLGISPTKYHELIEARLASGRTDRPTIVKNEVEMVDTISKTIGGIGYIGDGKFLLSENNSVKILKVIFN